MYSNLPHLQLASQVWAKISLQNKEGSYRIIANIPIQVEQIRMP